MFTSIAARDRAVIYGGLCDLCNEEPAAQGAYCDGCRARLRGEYVHPKSNEPKCPLCNIREGVYGNGGKCWTCTAPKMEEAKSA